MLSRPNTAIADRVMSFLDALIPHDLAQEVFVERYTNCREQGYALSMGGRQAVFAECRNSDSCVVFYGKTQDFAFNTNIPSDVTYKTGRKDFPFGSDLQAAEFIYDFVCGGEAK